MSSRLAGLSGAILIAGSVLAAGCAAAGTQPVAPPSQPAAEKPAVQSGPPVRTVQPGAPGEPSRVVTSSPVAAPKHTAADVAFMQGMIGHHAQAIEMVALLKTRTQSEDMRLLGLRVEVSQNDEIKMMQTWLRERGESVPAEHAHHMAGAKLMPGMLTEEQMSRLSAARGVEFDKLFLELMIQHHEGALTMVKELMATPGAAQESNLFAFVSDVEADQSAEITRMRRMRAMFGK
jgi:uncharacterized protein (DUF305 family)